MRWPKDHTGLCYGGDWNPEQWPESIWREDLALMREARVTLVTLGVFAWSRIEPEPGRYDLEWLDRILDATAEAGIGVNLATPTASPPPWFSLAHPDALPVTADGRRLLHGSRDTYCVAAPAYRAAAARVAETLARRYARHPALAMWHVHNEYGTRCHCDHVAAAFRRWLLARHGDLDQLNQVWGTAFWGQRYGAWEQVYPPRATQYLGNPHQALDFRRYLSDELRSAYREQRDLLRAANPAVPVTTNAAFGDWVPVDHRRWAADTDLVALDAYPRGFDVAAEEEGAFLADIARHWAGGEPWLLMEHAPGAVGDGTVTSAAAPGRWSRAVLGQVARGSRGAMFFQWRASAVGAEQYHPAAVPHAGPASRVFAEARELGATLSRLAEVDAGRIAAQVAIGWDVESWWALEQPHLPSDRLDYLAALRRAHGWLWRRQYQVDFADLTADLSGYRLVLVPSHYLASDAAAAGIRRYVDGGGRLVVWYFSGIADEHSRVRLGGYPGAFREVLGVRVTALHPLPAGGTVALSDGTRARRWSEEVESTGAAPLIRYAEGPLLDRPAVTRHRYGAGAAWYISTELATPAYDRVLAEALEAATVVPVLPGLPPGLEVVCRRRGDVRWWFLLNHTEAAVTVPVSGLELVTGGPVDHPVVAAGGYAVVRSTGVH